MTVLVGILCQDGVVIGSDSSATFAAGRNLNTIEQPVRKTFLVGTDVIFATTGAGGLGQRFEHVLRALREQPQLDWPAQPHHELVLHISQRMIQNMQRTFHPTGQMGALVAFACQDAFHLCEFAIADFQPEMKTEDAWFVSMGSGQMITDPFFGLLRRTLFRDTRPTLVEGALAASWAVHNAIQLNTGGINGPIQLAVLHRPNPGAPFQARMLPEEELKEYPDVIGTVEDYLAGARQQLTQKKPRSGDEPRPPEQPPAGPVDASQGPH